MRINGLQAGFTLAEIMVTVAIVGILGLVGTNLVSSAYKAWRLSEARTEAQRDARTTLTLMQKFVKQASAASLAMDSLNASEPPYSRLQFSTPGGDVYQFYQQQGAVVMARTPVSGTATTTVLAKNLRYMAFSYANTNQPNLVNVATCFEVKTLSAQSKDFFMSLEKIEIENP